MGRDGGGRCWSEVLCRDNHRLRKTGGGALVFLLLATPQNISRAVNSHRNYPELPKSAAAVAIFARLSGVYFQSAPAEVMTVKFFNGDGPFFLRGHLDKTKAARAARFTIFNHAGAFDCARLCEQRL